MVTGEVSTPAKPSKPMETRKDSASAKSCKSAVLTQAFYGTGATSSPLLSPPIASSSTPPYLWGNQGAVLTIPEAEGKIFNIKDLDLMEKSAFIGGRSGESGNIASGSTNDGASQRAASGREGSSDAREDNTSQEIFATKKRSNDQMLAGGADTQNNCSAKYSNAIPVLELNDPLVSKPVVNLNAGMSLNGSCTDAMPLEVKPTASSVLPVVDSAMMDGSQQVVAEKWIKDEHELKKERRKQSNRESARRSRLRKQQECGKLEASVEALLSEISMLKDELMGISEECMKQNSKNNSLMEELIQMYGADAISSLEAKKSDGVSQSISGESNSHEQEGSSEDNSSSGQTRDNSTF
ncbi:hypothetical protein L1049_014783 [Liquidambar formosana]|uniref:BZIP domain-containing protein n=1 Tax=Liquidambar formosana TaxID=63359 RepID=A0AAP0X5N4_LIQFO